MGEEDVVELSVTICVRHGILEGERLEGEECILDGCSSDRRSKERGPQGGRSLGRHRRLYE